MLLGRSILACFYFQSIRCTCNVKDCHNEGGINVLVIDEIVQGVDIFFSILQEIHPSYYFKEPL